MIESLLDLVNFLKQFYSGWAGQPDFDASLIPGDLPQPLLTIYNECSSLIELGATGPFGGHYTLRRVRSLLRIEGMVEFGGDYVAGYSFRCQLKKTDPPVYSDVGKFEESGNGFQIVCQSLTHFLTTLCLLQAVDSCRYTLSFDPASDLTHTIVPELTPIWREGYFAWGRPVFDFFAVPGRKVIVMSCALGWPIIVGSPDGPVEDLVCPEAAYEVIAAGAKRGLTHG
jgi:hypothetical protein